MSQRFNLDTQTDMGLDSSLSKEFKKQYFQLKREERILKDKLYLLKELALQKPPELFRTQTTLKFEAKDINKLPKEYFQVNNSAVKSFYKGVATGNK